MKIDPKHLKRDSIQVKNGFHAKEGGTYRLDKPSLEHHLKHGSYSMISAGNPHDAATGKQKTLSKEENNKRHNELKAKLTKDGAIFHEAMGHYGQPERALMVHHRGNINPEYINKLGKHYEQHTVLHSSENKHQIHYTHGKDEGSHHKGEGHEVSDHMEGDHTHVPQAGKFKSGLDFDHIHKKEEEKRKLQFYTIPLTHGKHVKVKFNIDHENIHKD